MSTELEIETSVYINEPTWDKIDILTKNIDNEWAGFLVGKIDKEGINITDVLIPEQEVTTAGVDIDGLDLGKLRKEFGDRCAGIIGHVHSHNSMTPFWSGTDHTCMDTMMDVRDCRIFLVTSKSKGYKCRVEIRNPFKMAIDNIRLSMLSPRKSELKEKIMKEVKDKIKEKTYRYGGGYNNGYNGGYNNNWNNGYWNESETYPQTTIEYRKKTKQIEIANMDEDQCAAILMKYNEQVTAKPMSSRNGFRCFISCKSKKAYKEIEKQIEKCLVDPSDNLLELTGLTFQTKESLEAEFSSRLVSAEYDTWNSQDSKGGWRAIFAVADNADKKKLTGQLYKHLAKLNEKLTDYLLD